MHPMLPNVIGGDVDNITTKWTTTTTTIYNTNSHLATDLFFTPSPSIFVLPLLSPPSSNINLIVGGCEGEGIIIVGEIVLNVDIGWWALGYCWIDYVLNDAGGGRSW
jgi:hypothetical protein